MGDKVAGGAGAQRGDDIGDDKRPHGSRTQKTPRAGKNAPSVPPSSAPKDPGRERYSRKSKMDSEWEDSDLGVKGGSSSTDSTWTDRTADDDKERRTQTTTVDDKWEDDDLKMKGGSKGTVTTWSDNTEAKETVCNCDPKEGVCMCGPREEMEKFWHKENLTPVGMKIFVAESAMDELQELLGEDAYRSIKITESNAGKVPYFAKILAAYPTKSLNGRIYSAEVLDDASKRYVGKPFILDHDYEDSYKVHGKIVGAHYGVDESPFLNRKREGLWLDAIGLMPAELVPLVQGEGAIPPLLRGVSIGGEGDAEPTSEGMRLKRFFPTELSVTAFPGIEGAHIADFQTVTEMYN